MCKYVVHYGRRIARLEREVPIHQGEKIVTSVEEEERVTWNVDHVVHFDMGGHGDCVHVLCSKTESVAPGM